MIKGNFFFIFISLFVGQWMFIECLGVNRTYLIKKDFVSGLKGGEFTIYDPTGKNLRYRMETKLGVTHDVRIFKATAKKDILARLKAKITPVMYKATLSIFNPLIDQWTNGTIQQNYKFVGNKFTIEWKGQTIIMEGAPASLDTTFIQQNNKEVLAKFHKRVSSLFWRNKYDLQVLSDKYPDELYFLGVAARDHSNKKIHRG